MSFIIHTDGGARGNPGPAAIGAVIEEQDSAGKRSTIDVLSKRIGETTNNVAEYTAVFEALAFLKNFCLKRNIHNPIVICMIDSRLIVNQLNGLFKVKDSRMRHNITRIRIVEQELGGTIRYTLIPRNENSRADMLVNQALDNDI